VQHHALHSSSSGRGHTRGASFLTLLLTFAAFAAAANREEIGVLVVSASAEPLKKIAAIKTAKNFIVDAIVRHIEAPRGADVHTAIP
jgi:hypothetical protein